MAESMQKIPRKRIRAAGHRVQFLNMSDDIALPLRRIHIARTGLGETPAPFHATPGPTCGVHVLFYPFKGEYSILTREGRRSLQKGMVFRVHQKETRHISLASSYGRHFFVHLKMPTPWDKAIKEAAPVRRCPYVEQLEQSVRNYLREAIGSHCDSLALAGSYAEIIALLVSRELVSGISPLESEQRHRMDELWHRVAMSPEDDWTVARLAADMGVSVPHFHDLCQKFKQYPPRQLLIRFRLEKAKGLLNTTSDTIESIAAEVGYANPYAFSRMFLKHVGVRPGKYRSGQELKP